ncbi:hypothetical protein D918_00316 [Trichuris suis]|nr:hypothetical protein D918_00316 [Trichuris suis]
MVCTNRQIEKRLCILKIAFFITFKEAIRCYAMLPIQLNRSRAAVAVTAINAATGEACRGNNQMIHG